MLVETRASCTLRIIQEQLSNEVIEEVKPRDEGLAGKVHYLPHQAVIRRDKETTKICVVYDASSRGAGQSLLHTGPRDPSPIQDVHCGCCGRH